MKLKFAYVLMILLTLTLVSLQLMTPITTKDIASWRDNYIPQTISATAKQKLAQLYEQKIYATSISPLNNKGEWRRIYADFEKQNIAINHKAAIDNQTALTETVLGNVPILDIRPANWKENHKVIVYLHGGGYIYFSPVTTLTLSAPICRATKQRIIAIDYTTAPNADWQLIQDQVVSVFKALLAEGYTMKDIALFGDSAGGGLAISTTLNLRDKGMGMPAALVLLSPWADLSSNGDTMHTLLNTDPILNYEYMLKPAALAYANGLQLTDPRVSPLYANFDKGFPPTLIVEGTKDIFLSGSVRLYQALDHANQNVTLDMHEGMWHVFMSSPMPESSNAINKIAAFINKHLAG